MDSIAHIRIEDGCIQTVEEHLLDVKSLSEQFGEKLGVKYIAGLAGLLHDLGKYSPEFVDYIKKAVYEPEQAPARGSVDHSSAGGKLIYKLLHSDSGKNKYQKVLVEIVGNAIISHHAYLHDFLSPELTSPYLKRVKDKHVPAFHEVKKSFFEKVMNKTDFKKYTDKATSELKRYIDMTSDNDREAQLMFLSKFIFSCLLDADRTNTRHFVEYEEPHKKDNPQQLFKDYYRKLLNKLDEFAESPDGDHYINVLRAKMSNQCDEFAERESGIYTLSIPTGGGKTLASLRYALKHAQLYHKKRIIYVVPYTTIIEQNAAKVREILGEESFVLEHHSNAVHDREEEEDIYTSEIGKKTMLAKDNWDTPIIFTTMVQFLNVFYAYSSRDIRRLHNLTQSVLIFDEVQKVPVHCVSLFNRALNFLKKFGNSSIVLCTATQPALDYVSRKLDIDEKPEMIDDISLIVEKFKRVNIVDEASNESYTKEKLLSFIDEKLNDVENMLIVLNTKSVVKELYEELKLKYIDDIPVYHLSTAMCASHRTFILETVKSHLENNERVICVSTQLIEAGVDISFQSVIRSLAGLDSIAQSAGRCNRHGHLEQGNVYVIDYIEENLKYLNEIKIGKSITKKIFKDLSMDQSAHGGSILSPQAMTFYFENFYKEMEVELDYVIKDMNQTMVQLLEAKRSENELLAQSITRNRNSEILSLILCNSYRTAAKKFAVIDSKTYTIIVPYGKGEEIIAELNGDFSIERLGEILQEAQLYSINVYPYELDILKENESIVSLLDGQVFALKSIAYDPEYGLNMHGDVGHDFLIS